MSNVLSNHVIGDPHLVSTIKTMLNLGNTEASTWESQEMPTLTVV